MSRAFVVVALLLVAVAPARADDKAAAKRRAGELAAEAAQHYKRGEFEVSAALVRQAYGLYPEPNLLYNLARSLEGMGDKTGAVDAYEQYLASAKNIEDRGALERRVATLKAELESAKPAEPAPPATPPPPPRPPPTPPVLVMPPPPPPYHASPLPWVPIVLGAATAGTGGAFAYLSSNRHDAAVSDPSASHAQSLQNTAQTDATLANVLFAVGGAVAVGGIVWEIVERHHEHDSNMTARVRVAPSSVGLEVTW
jgi:tetratricopeptide (TPR) repeat protein